MLEVKMEIKLNQKSPIEGQICGEELIEFIKNGEDIVVRVRDDIVFNTEDYFTFNQRMYEISKMRTSEMIVRYTYLDDKPYVGYEGWSWMLHWLEYGKN